MEVILFGITREIVGEKKLVLNAGEDFTNVGELKTYMKNRFPRLQQLSSFAVAVDSEYANDDTSLINENEVALIPPVSGG